MPSNHRSLAGPDLWKGLASGLAGGLAGGLAMVALQGVLARATGDGPRPGLDDVAGDAAGGSFAAEPDPSTIRGARAASLGLLGRDLPRGHEATAGRAFHLAFGLALGGLYGVLVEYLPFASAGLGLPFGTLHAIFADDASVPALGLSGPSTPAPARARAATLAVHAAYGVATELVRRRVRARGGTTVREG